MPGEDDQAAAERARAEHGHRNDSIIDDLFQGQLKSTMRCGKCGFRSVTFEPFTYLSLPVSARSRRVTLAACIDEFRREEVLGGADSWFCPQCKQHRPARKKIEVWNLPWVPSLSCSFASVVR